MRPIRSVTCSRSIVPSSFHLLPAHSLIGPLIRPTVHIPIRHFIGQIEVSDVTLIYSKTGLTALAMGYGGA